MDFRPGACDLAKQLILAAIIGNGGIILVQDLRDIVNLPGREFDFYIDGFIRENWFGIEGQLLYLIEDLAKGAQPRKRFRRPPKPSIIPIQIGPSCYRLKRGIN